MIPSIRGWKIITVVLIVSNINNTNDLNDLNNTDISRNLIKYLHDQITVLTDDMKFPKEGFIK